MEEHDWLAQRFEAHRTHLRTVAYRMLGSVNDADDAVQEAWIRLSRTDTSDEIAPIVGRSPTATRQLASRARRRVRGAPVPDPDLARQREVVDAFLGAVRKGDFEALVAVLDPDVVLRVDGGVARPGFTRIVHGAEAVAARALTFRRFAESARLALVSGAVGGVAWAPDGSPLTVMAFTVQNGRIVALDALADPDRLREIDLTVLEN